MVISISVAKKMTRRATIAGGVDTVVFTGGIGERRVDIRKRILEKSAWLENAPVIVSSPEEGVAVIHHAAMLLSGASSV